MCFCSTQSMSHCLSEALPQRQRSLLCGQTPVAATHCTGSPSLLVTLGVRDAAQRKLLDEVAFLLRTCLLMDSFLWVECCLRHLLMGSGESTNIITSYLLTSSPFSLGILGQGSDVLQVSPMVMDGMQES